MATVRRIGPSEIRRIEAEIRSTNVALIGAPRTGKSTLTEDLRNPTVCTTFSEIPRSTEEPIIIDGFYQLYTESRESDGDQYDLFNTHLERESGVCIVTRPRRFDWLLQHTNLQIGSFKAFLLEYDEDDAINTCQDIAPDIDRDALQKNINYLNYRYEFKSESLTGRSYDSYAPYLISDISAKGSVGTIFPNGLPTRDETSLVRKQLRRLSNINQENLKSVGSEIIKEIPGMLVGPPGTIASKIATEGWRALHEDSTLESHPKFEHLIGNLHLPTTRAVFEERLDLPPGTIRNLQTLFDPVHRQKLGEIIEEYPEIQASIEEQSESIRNIKDRMGELETRNDQAYGFISELIERAALPIEETLQEELEELERESYLNVTTPPEWERIPYFGDTATKLANSIRNEAQIIILTGGHGVGKSTSMVNSALQLGSTYATKQLNPDVKELSYLRQNIQGTNSLRTVLYTQYLLSSYGAELEDIVDSLKLIGEGHIETIVIECRSELHREFINEIERRIAGNQNLGSLWEERARIECERLESSEIESIISWTSSEIDGDLSEREIIDIGELAEGNPELAKIATQQIVRGAKFENVGSADEIVWNEIRDVFPIPQAGEDARGKILDYLCISRGLTESELREFVNEDPEPYRQELADYITITDGTPTNHPSVDDYNSGPIPAPRSDDKDVWRLSPDIYTDIAFRRQVVHHLDWRVPEIYGNSDDQVSPTHLRLISGLATNLQIAYSAARERGDEKSMLVITDRSDQLVSQMDDQPALAPFFLTAYLRIVIGSRIPISPESLNVDSLQRTHIQAEVFGMEFSSIGEMGSLAYLCSNNLFNGKLDSFDKGVDLAISFAEKRSDDSVIRMAEFYITLLQEFWDSPSDPLQTSKIPRVTNALEDTSNKLGKLDLAYDVYRDAIINLVETTQLVNGIGAFDMLVKEYSTFLEEKYGAQKGCPEIYGLVLAEIYCRRIPDSEGFRDWASHIRSMFDEYGAPSRGQFLKAYFETVSEYAKNGNKEAKIALVWGVNNKDAFRDVISLSTMSDESSEELLKICMSCFNATLDWERNEIWKAAVKEFKNRFEELSEGSESMNITDLMAIVNLVNNQMRNLSGDSQVEMTASRSGKTETNK